ncbi:hypothetical protein BKP37_11080 [Anaerobacillus alkalilacustris]|uniref:Sporulation protein YjcZ n=1 Tax=Anaerobacillus alkalilacustris TaxID=393763 RepID=A0A1S2LKM0_9BACI|nr:YjcZ family sporulation protein [Anaerobacillus alkalilacustris]OIJ13052.1 hypothetical protein BKP37_11080 [Anaerobacillus alkalilacustris]
MYSNVNAPPTLGANIPPNIPPMPTYTAPVYGYGYGYTRPTHQINYFTLIVVLFILLVIVGASYFN